MCLGTVSKNTERAACDLNFLGRYSRNAQSNFVKKKRPGGADFFFMREANKSFSQYTDLARPIVYPFFFFFVYCLVTWCPVKCRYGNVTGRR